MSALCTACDNDDECGVNEFCESGQCQCLPGYSGSPAGCVGMQYKDGLSLKMKLLKLNQLSLT